MYILPMIIFEKNVKMLIIFIFTPLRAGRNLYVYRHFFQPTDIPRQMINSGQQLSKSHKESDRIRRMTNRLKTESRKSSFKCPVVDSKY